MTTDERGMNSDIDWGGTAFPCEGGARSGLHPSEGMSYRAWLAGQALAGFCANSSHLILATDYEKIAEWSVLHADAMIERLKR